MKVQKIEAIVEPVLKDLGFRLVQLRLSQAGRRTLQIMAEPEDLNNPMTLEDCVAISRALSPVLDVEDPVAGSYSLEVSSPGLDRPLVKLSDFERYQSHLVTIETRKPVEEKRKLTATIKSVHEDGTITFAQQDGEFVLAYEQIYKARLKITDAMLRKGRA